MINKFAALAVAFAFLTFTGVGFTSDQIFSVIEDRDPEIRFEAVDRFSQAFGW